MDKTKSAKKSFSGLPKNGTLLALGIQHFSGKKKKLIGPEHYAKLFVCAEW